MAGIRNEGGQAFPHDDKHEDGSHYHSHLGMTLRQYYAGQAMAALLVHTFESARAEGVCAAEASELVAEAACKVADALIAELGK